MIDDADYIHDVKLLKPEIGDLPVRLANHINDIARQQFPEFIPDFPFFNLYASDSYIAKDYVGVTVYELYHRSGTIMADTEKDDYILSRYSKLFKENPYPTFEEIDSAFNGQGIAFDTFVYVGKLVNGKISSRHVSEVLTAYLNSRVLPVISERNRMRVLRAIPPPPNYDINKIVDNTYIIEVDSISTQGTAFHLSGYGLITCQHCITLEKMPATDITIFHPSHYSKKSKARCIKSQGIIDLAILETDMPLNKGLDIGVSDSLVRMDHLAICGFPNYRFGDSGVFSPGLVVGFRPQSGINRILINTPLIAGMSGGPVVNAIGAVIGVAVTGADKMENAIATENHGVIPIEALKYLRTEEYT